MKFEFSLKSKEVTILFLRSLMITTTWSKSTPAMFGQACVFLFTIVPPFSLASKTQSTLFISIPSLWLDWEKEKAAKRWVRAWVLFMASKTSTLFLSSVPSRRWNKEGSEKRKVVHVVFSNPSIHPSHSTCVECLPLFRCSPRYRIHLFPAHYLPSEKNTNSLCVKLKAPGKGKSQLCWVEPLHVQGLTKTSILVENFWNISKVFKQLCKPISLPKTPDLDGTNWNFELILNVFYFISSPSRFWPLHRVHPTDTNPHWQLMQTKWVPPWFSNQIHILNGFSGYLVLITVPRGELDAQRV